MRYNYGGYNFPRAGRSSGFSNSYPATIRLSKDPKPNWNQKIESKFDKILYSTISTEIVFEHHNSTIFFEQNNCIVLVFCVSQSVPAILA